MCEKTEIQIERVIPKVIYLVDLILPNNAFQISPLIEDYALMNSGVAINNVSDIPRKKLQESGYRLPCLFFPLYRRWAVFLIFRVMAT